MDQSRYDNSYGRMMTHSYFTSFNGHHSDVTSNHLITYNNGGVYNESGHVDEDHVMSHEQEEYIDIAVNKLFNGECELEKDDCGEGHDSLPAINSLLLPESAI